LKKVILYTDGACSGNPGPGGWGCVLFYGEHKKELRGAQSQTTNQRMELTAVKEGLCCLKEPCNVEIFSDSAYVVNAFLQHWLDNWQKNGWKNAQKKPVENQDLWKEIFELSIKHQINWNKVKGHAGNEWNERCDLLARQAITEINEMDETGRGCAKK